MKYNEVDYFIYSVKRNDEDKREHMYYYQIEKEIKLHNAKFCYFCKVFSA